MSISPRRPKRNPLISRRYEPSRLQHDSLVSAYFYCNRFFVTLLV
jgi:hypothetical protein